MMDRARGGNGIDFEYEHRLLMPDHRVKYVSMVCEGIRESGRSTGIYRGGSGCDAAPTVGRSVSNGPIGARTRGQDHKPGALTASIAHEVNQPLSGIITNASTCLRMLGRGSSKR